MIDFIHQSQIVPPYSGRSENGFNEASVSGSQEPIVNVQNYSGTNTGLNTDEEPSLWSGIAILFSLLFGVAVAVTWKFQSLPLICQLTK